MYNAHGGLAEIPGLELEDKDSDPYDKIPRLLVPSPQTPLHKMFLWFWCIKHSTV